MRIKLLIYLQMLSRVPSILKNHMCLVKLKSTVSKIWLPSLKHSDSSHLTQSKTPSPSSGLSYGMCPLFLSEFTPSVLDSARSHYVRPCNYFWPWHVAYHDALLGLDDSPQPLWCAIPVFILEVPHLGKPGKWETVTLTLAYKKQKQKLLVTLHTLFYRLLDINVQSDLESHMLKMTEPPSAWASEWSNYCLHSPLDFMWAKINSIPLRLMKPLKFHCISLTNKLITMLVILASFLFSEQKKHAPTVHSAQVAPFQTSAHLHSQILHLQPLFA